eukprot:m.138400 g.138400  ORF g.138400 m.138400 type:complete len:1254 (-) comp9957_c0_seq1:255-4016(-)
MEPVELGTGWSHPLELDPVRKVGEKPNPQAEFGTPLAPILLLARDTEHFPQHGRANALPTCVLQELRAGVLCEVQALGRTLPGVKLQLDDFNHQLFCRHADTNKELLTISILDLEYAIPGRKLLDDDLKSWHMLPIEDEVSFCAANKIDVSEVPVFYNFVCADKNAALRYMHLVRELILRARMIRDPYNLKLRVKFLELHRKKAGDDGIISALDALSAIQAMASEADLFEDTISEYEACSGSRGILFFSEFCLLVACHYWILRTDLRSVFEKYTSANGAWTIHDLSRFLEEQDNRYNADDSAQDVIFGYELLKDFREQNLLSPQGFVRMMLSHEYGNAFDPIHDCVHQNMNLPTSFYFINSSHNTYVVKNQLVGLSSTELYIRVLLSNCRCVELDCWDGSDGLPEISHKWIGYSLLSNISFENAIKAISAVAFQNTSLGLILSFENHCTAPQEAIMLDIMKREFGSALVLDLLPGLSTAQLPTPSELAGQILVRVKIEGHTFRGRPSAEDAMDELDEELADEAEDEDSSSPAEIFPLNASSLPDVEEIDRVEKYAPISPVSSPGAESGSRRTSASSSPKRTSPVRSARSSFGSTDFQYTGSRRSSRASPPSCRRASVACHSIPEEAPSEVSEMQSPRASMTQRRSIGGDAAPMRGRRSVCISHVDSGFLDQHGLPAARFHDYLRRSSIEAFSKQASLEREMERETSKATTLSEVSSASTICETTHALAKMELGDMYGDVLAPPTEGDEAEADEAPVTPSRYTAVECLSYESLLQHVACYMRNLSFRWNREIHPFETSSFSDDSSKLKKLLKKREQTAARTRMQIIRVYPRARNILSQNFSPCPYWAAGIQMVALNHQTLDDNMGLNDAMFELNGGGGYVLKPAHLLARVPVARPVLDRMELSLTIFSLQGPWESNNCTFEVQVVGDEKHHEAIPSTMTKAIRTSSVWLETFSFRVQEPDLAFLKITVRDPISGFFLRRFIALQALRPGYRHLAFKDARNNLTDSSVFLHIVKQPIFEPQASIPTRRFSGLTRRELAPSNVKAELDRACFIRMEDQDGRFHVLQVEKGTDGLFILEQYFQIKGIARLEYPVLNCGVGSAPCSDRASSTIRLVDNGRTMNRLPAGAFTFFVTPLCLTDIPEGSCRDVALRCEQFYAISLRSGNRRLSISKTNSVDCIFGVAAMDVMIFVPSSPKDCAAMSHSAITSCVQKGSTQLILKARGITYDFNCGSFVMARLLANAISECGAVVSRRTSLA